MSEISPFRGVLYARERVRPGDAIAPPYDVIDRREHERLLARSPWNIARVTVGEEAGAPGGDHEGRAAALRRWLEEGTLVRDAGPSYYAYRIRCRVPESGRAGELRALVGCVRLDGAIRPHESTFPRVVEDRLMLLRATRANLGQILLLYAGPDPALDEALRRAAAGEPLVRVAWDAGEEHALFRLADPDLARAVERVLGAATLTIADGHHRFETARRYAREVEEAGAPAGLREAARRRMAAIADLRRGGVSILPTHRMVRFLDPSARPAERARFLRTFPPSDGTGPLGEDQMVLYSREEPAGRRVAIPEGLREGEAGAGRTAAAILHRRFLGATRAAIEYPRDRSEGIRAVGEGRADLFLELPPLSVETFLEVLTRGDLFPHKTTCFYPKLFTGLVLRDLEGEGG